MGKMFKWAMFITSFLPLWVTIIFINILSIIKNSNNLYTEYIGIILIFIINLISILVVLKSISSIELSEYNSYVVIDSKYEKAITSEFLLSYVLPLFVFDFTQWDGIIQFLIYFIVLAFLCIRNNTVYANLILEIKKYKFYECQLQWKSEPNSDPIQAMVISKNNLWAQKGNTIKIASLNKPFYLMKDLKV